MLLVLALTFALLGNFDPAFAGQGDCGQPTTDGETPSATDALGALQAALGLSVCETCTCDVDRDLGVTASDALAILKSSVGQDVEVRCVGCARTKTIAAGGGAITTPDGRMRVQFLSGSFGGDTEVTVAGVHPDDLPAPMTGTRELDAYIVDTAGSPLLRPALAEIRASDAPSAGTGNVQADMPILATSPGSGWADILETTVVADTSAGTVRWTFDLDEAGIVLLVDERGGTVATDGLPESAALGVPGDIVCSADPGAERTAVAAEYSDTLFIGYGPADDEPVENEPLVPQGDGSMSLALSYACSFSSMSQWGAEIDYSERGAAPWSQDAVDRTYSVLLNAAVSCE